jgi:hypothetical protein
MNWPARVGITSGQTRMSRVWLTLFANVQRTAGLNQYLEHRCL